MPDNLQHTNQHRPDLLKKVTDDRGETFVLHIELQLYQDPDMIFRIAEYYIMARRRHLQQLRILANLRTFISLNWITMDSIASLINEEADFLCLRGEEKGETKAADRFIRNLLTHTNHTSEEIAELTDVALAGAEELRREL